MTERQDSDPEKSPENQTTHARAAEYVRMSTEHQKYSTENQGDTIHQYAARKGYQIVKTYADEGRSGLNIDGRDGLQRLINDVETGQADFSVILVYDVSRWGRFQDSDESAFYEYLCKRAGIRVEYCAEQFENDGSISSTIVKTVKRAMAGEYSRELSVKVFPLEVTYLSISSGNSKREIVPFALVDNGLRWHVRAFDRARERFSDFVINRIATTKPAQNASTSPHERKEADKQWNRIVEMQIAPHPGLKHPEAISLEYGMVDNLLDVEVRAAVAGYLLRKWNVDCTENHHLTGPEYHLWLKNTPTLYGVENLAIAPGYTGHNNEQSPTDGTNA